MSDMPARNPLIDRAASDENRAAEPDNGATVGATGDTAGRAEPSSTAVVQTSEIRREEAAAVNPFWSQKAIEETELAAARPAFLETSSGKASSGSTEMRRADDLPPQPEGIPESFGPSGPAVPIGTEGDLQDGSAEMPGLRAGERMVLTEMRNLMEVLINQNKALTAQNSTLQTRVDRLEEERSNSQAWRSAESAGVPEAFEGQGVQGLTGGTGISEGDLGDSELGRFVQGSLGRGMQGIAAQVSCAVAEPPEHTIVFQHGYEEGYQAAKQAFTWESERRLSQSPPSVSDARIEAEDASTAYRARTPEPSTTRIAYLDKVNTTPQGTPIPAQPPRPPPPEPPKNPVINTPSFPTAGVEDRRDSAMSGEIRESARDGRNQLSEWQRLFRGEPVLPSEVRSSTVGIQGRQSEGEVGVREKSFPSVGGADAHDVGPDPWATLDLGTVGSSGGRDPFLPGERTYWTLPVLGDSSEPGAPTRAADWFTQIRPLLYDLSDMSQVWWDRVEYEARHLYQQWSLAPALDKGLVLPKVSDALSQARFRRLESRAFGMLQAAVPQLIRDELVATRSMHCVGLVYQVLKIFCPGGLQERAQVLSELTSLGIAKNSADAVHALRAWTRSYARARTMGVVVPDPALVLKGVDSMTEALLKKPQHSQVAFRISTARNQLHLDHRPNMSTVVEFMRVLQSEWEQVAVSGVDESSTKPPKAARVEVESSGEKGEKPGEKGEKGPKGNSKGYEGKGPKGGTKDQDNGSKSGGPKGSKGLCGFYLTSKGCSKGRDCGFFHDFASAKGQGRCFTCGSDQHKQQDCTRPKGKGKGKQPLGESSSTSERNSTAATVGAGSSGAPNSGTASQSEPRKENDAHGASRSNPSVASAQTQVLEEAQKLLKSLRIAALRIPESIHESGEQTEETDSDESVIIPQIGARRVRSPKGLLDGGATHPLRTATAEEWDQGQPTCVSMAVGTQQLRITPLGTILTQERIVPICPLGQLVDRLGCKVLWQAGTCRIVHPYRGIIEAELEGSCPVVDEALCLQLIGELETYQGRRLQQALSLKALSLGVAVESLEDVVCPWGSEKGLLTWLNTHCSEWPESLKMKAVPDRGDQSDEGVHRFLRLNRRHRKALKRATAIVLNLFSGGMKTVQFGDVGSGVVFLNIDMLLGRDLLDDSAYSWLAALCSSGKVCAVLAKPPSGSFQKRESDASAVRYLRGRSGDSRFGVHENAPQEQQLVEQQSLLLLRSLVLHHLADEARSEGCMFALEHPQDPQRMKVPASPESVAPGVRESGQAPSIWSWPILEDRWKHQKDQWHLAEFDLGLRVKQSKRQSAILTNSWFLFQSLHGRENVDRSDWVNHSEFQMLRGSRIREGRWTVGFPAILGSAVKDWNVTTRQERKERQREERITIRALSKEEEAFKRHCEQDHVVFRKDCRTCLQAAMRGQRHLRQKHQHANALTLNLDLIGPWIPGDDHSLPGPAKHILVATLGVPVYQDGKPVLLSQEKERKDEEKEEKESDEIDDGGGIGPLDAGEVVLDDDNPEEEEQEGEEPLSEEEMKNLREQQEEVWKEKMKELREPVKIHNILFAEPLQSKKSGEVLRAVQRVYARVTLLNLSVRRAHSDGGREFTNKAYKAWCASRDIHITYSPPSDPRANGRVEGAVGQVKAGIRALLTLKPHVEKRHWPSALRQYVAQRFEQSMKEIGGVPAKRPLVPFGTPVTVQSRNWSRKTPYASRAIDGISLCPAANVSGCTVMLLPPDDEDVDRPKFHVAPVLYQGVKDPLEFKAEEILGEEPSPAGPHVVRRRVSFKQPVVAHACVGGESVESECEKVLLEEPPDSTTDAVDACHSGSSSECLASEVPQEKERSGEKYALEESERRATEMLNSGGEVKRTDVDDLLSKSLTRWNPKTRKCDVDLKNQNALGWTLGAFMYGTKVGITRETLRRPQLTKLLNRYLSQVGGSGNWAALRVTCDFRSGMHVDRNLKGSLNLFVPISRFEDGRIWIEGSSEYGKQVESRIIDQVQVQGEWIGGSEGPCWFDSSKRHAVEAAQGARRVVVGYTPRNLEKLTDKETLKLRELGFPIVGNFSEVSHEPGGTEPLDGERPSEACVRACETLLDDDELRTLRHEHVMLRNFLIDEYKCVGEEVATAAHEGWEASTLPLHDLYAWIDECEQNIVWQDSCDQLRCGNVGESEGRVLEARLARLGVSGETALYDEECGDDSLEHDIKPEAWEATPAQPLQTVSVSHQEVLQKIEEWKGAIGDELSNVFDVHSAMKRRDEEYVRVLKESGVEVEILPAKALFHRKGGSGRHKCRVVACGNFSESAREKGRDKKVQCYAGGADSLSLRCHLRAAGYRAVRKGWRTSGSDVRTAFLLAPLRQPGKVTILRPPSVITQAGFSAPGELWEVTGALYGLQSSPAAWATFRDETLPTFEVNINEQITHLEQSKHDPNLWLLRSPTTAELLAILTIYVDDLLLSGTPEASTAIWKAIKEKWKISEPEFADEGQGITFCGFEIRQDDNGLHVGQSKYVQSLLDKYSAVTGVTSTPYAKESEPVCKPQDSLEKLRRAQGLVGELLWLATRTRADLVYGVSRIGQLITRDVDQAIQRAEDMIRYLRTTKHQEVRYGIPGEGHGPGSQLPIERDFNLIEVFADASFCPGSDRSQTGIVLMWGNAPIGWMSMRQPCASLSTAEAELQASLDGMTLAEGLHGLLSELAEAPQRSFLYNDNVGACTVMSLPQGSWRTRHLRLKAAWFFEQLELSRFKAYHVPGKYMLGDLCTKPLLGPRIKELLSMMSVTLEKPSDADGGESDSLKEIKRYKLEPVESTGSGGDGRVAQALRAITAASLIDGVASKLMKIQVEIEEEKNQLDEIFDLLKYISAVLVLIGLVALVAWKCWKHESVDAPRIRSVRGLDSEGPDDDWSAILESEPASLDRGTEGRLGGSWLLTSPASNHPSGSRTPDDDGVTSGCGSRSLAGPARDDPNGSRTTPDDNDGDEGLGTTTVEGLRRRISGFPKSSPHPNLMREGSRERGAISEQEAASSSGDPRIDEEPNSQALPQQVGQPAATHRERLVIRPGWTLKAPPILDRSKIPDWGGPEALVHQRLPPGMKSDEWFIDRRRGVLTRFHAVPRKRLYMPSQQGIPTGVQWTTLTGRRRTLAISSPTKVALSFEDRFDVRDPRPARNLELPDGATSWTGRTEFEIVEDTTTERVE